MKKNIVMFLAFFIYVLPQVVMSSEFSFCEKVFSVATAAMENKKKGVSKETLIAALPPKITEIETEPLRSMREIAEDVYSFEITNQLVYSVYKTEYCVRRQSGESVPESFSEAFPALELCAKEKDKEREKEKEKEKNRIECAMLVADSKK